MRFLKIFFLYLTFFLLTASDSFANNYSNTAITMYNSAAALQNQGKYELAEQKYYQILKIQPDFIEAKKNLAIIYHKHAEKALSAGNYSKAIIYCKKELTYNPSRKVAYDVMYRSYYAMKDYPNTITTCNKIIASNPDDDSVLHMLAIAYLKTGQNDKAKVIYKKLLTLNPNDTVAKNNLKYADYQKTETALNQSLNSLQTQHVAPVALYALIKPEPGVPKDAAETMRIVLDLAWSEPNGRTMLKELLKRGTNINIVNYDSQANTIKTGQKHTFTYGTIPIITYDSSVIAVNIPISYIYNFKDPNLSAHKRVYNLHVFIHEIGHTFINLKDPKNEDSLEEEIGVSMIGYNLANKVLTGEYLNESQTEYYAKGCLQAALEDSHINLPVYSGFNNKIQAYGIILNHPEIYSDLPSMYKQLLYENKVTPASTFNRYMN